MAKPNDPSDAMSPPLAEALAVSLLLGIEEPDRSAKEFHKIGELRKEFGISSRTLRWYGEQGLLRPERRGTSRLYPASERRRLRIVLSLQDLGFSLAEIKQIVSDYARGEVGHRELESLVQLFDDQKSTLLEAYRATLKSIEALEVATGILRNTMNPSEDAGVDASAGSRD